MDNQYVILMTFFGLFLSGCSHKKCGDEYVGLKSQIIIEILMNNKLPVYPQVSVGDQIKNKIISSAGEGVSNIRKYLIKNGFSCDDSKNHCGLIENFISRPKKKCNDREGVEYTGKIEVNVFISKDESKNKINVSYKIHNLIKVK